MVNQTCETQQFTYHVILMHSDRCIKFLMIAINTVMITPKQTIVYTLTAHSQLVTQVLVYAYALNIGKEHLVLSIMYNTRVPKDSIVNQYTRKLDQEPL